jgi:integrase
MGMKSVYKRNQERPQSLYDLLRHAGPRIWTSPKHHKDCYSNVLDAIEIMGRPLLMDITTSMVDDYIAEVSVGIKPSTINRKLSALHTLLKYAYDREWLDKMPKFSWKREDNERVRWLSHEEEKQLLALLPPQVSAFCEILIHTGMRRGELMSLKVDQIDGDYVRLWKTKANKARSVPLTPRAKELLQQWAPFTLTVPVIHREWTKARKAMGMENDPGFVLHTLRHTTATRVLQTTNNIAVVQKVLGHAKVTTTMRYAHVSDETLLDAVRLTASSFQFDPTTT